MTDLVMAYEQDQHERIAAFQEPLTAILAYDEKRLVAWNNGERLPGGERAWLAQLFHPQTRQSLVTAHTWWADDIATLENIAGEHGCGIRWVPITYDLRMYWPPNP